jgi:hypothetical protein
MNPPRIHVYLDHVAVVHERQWSAHRGFRGDVQNYRPIGRDSTSGKIQKPGPD